MAIVFIYNKSEEIKLSRWNDLKSPCWSTFSIKTRTVGHFPENPTRTGRRAPSWPDDGTCRFHFCDPIYRPGLRPKAQTVKPGKDPQRFGPKERITSSLGFGLGAPKRSTSRSLVDFHESPQPTLSL